MTTHDASDAVVQPARAIETIAQAIQEMRKFYITFDMEAIDLTSEYEKQRLAGEKGVTWEVFPRNAMGRPTPILDTIMRRRGVILLSPYYTMFWDLRKSYWLAKSIVLVPGQATTFTKADAITIHRVGKGFDPGDEYVVTRDQILKAGHDHLDSAPTVGTEGKMVYSTPRSFISSTFHALDNVDSGLRQVIEDLRAFNASAAK